jgi:hypothetical protein
VLLWHSLAASNNRHPIMLCIVCVFTLAVIHESTVCAGIKADIAVGVAGFFFHVLLSFFFVGQLLLHNSERL